MGTVRARKRNRNRSVKRASRTRAFVKDLDQIAEDLSSKDASSFTAELNEDLPGLGQFYCIHCAIYFVSDLALKNHHSSKVHKRRLKQLKTPPYTQEEADAAAGLGKTTSMKNVSSVSFYDNRTGEQDTRMVSNYVVDSF